MATKLETVDTIVNVFSLIVRALKFYSTELLFLILAVIAL